MRRLLRLIPSVAAVSAIPVLWWAGLPVLAVFLAMVCGLAGLLYLIAGGSDGPGIPHEPLLGMWHARTRIVEGLDQPLGLHEAISAEEALRLYTTSAAYASFAEHERGVLKPGMPVTADIKVGRRNILSYLFARLLPVGLEGMREP